MSTVRADCPTCGEVEVPSKGMALYARPGKASFYMFECPSCKEGYLRFASQEVERIILDAGVKLTDEPSEVRETHKGSVISDMDITELHLELEDKTLIDGFFDTYPNRKVG